MHSLYKNAIYRLAQKQKIKYAYKLIYLALF
jgi:hypothetical protein